MFIDKSQFPNDNYLDINTIKAKFGKNTLLFTCSVIFKNCIMLAYGRLIKLQ